MDIRDWPMGKIMALPDWCFGRRWVLGCEKVMAGSTASFYLSPGGLPEWCVLWEFQVRHDAVLATAVGFSLGLSDAVPANLAEFNGLERVFPTVDDVANGVGWMRVLGERGLTIQNVRLPLQVAGRRLVFGLTNAGLAEARAVATVVVSGVPKEVPDWLCSV